MQQVKTFLPNSLESWLVVMGTVMTWLAAGWAMWTRLTVKVNGLGGRVKKVEEECKERDGRVGRLENEINEYRRDREISAKELGEMHAVVNSTNEHITELKLDIAGHMGDLKNLINERDSATRERLAVLETKIDRRNG